MNNPKILALILALMLALSSPGPLEADTPRHPDELEIKPIEFNMTEADRDSLSLGIPVFLFENHDLPLLNVSIRFKMGTRYVPLESFPASRLLSRTWRDGGTVDLSPDSLDRRLVEKNIRVSCWVGATGGGASVTLVKEDMAEALALWRDVLLHPGFDESRLERAKGKRLKSLQNINNDPSQIADRRFSWLLTGEDYVWSRSESAAELEAVQVEDLQALHRRFVHPRNAIIGVSGDFEKDEMLGLLNELFAGWVGESDYTPPVKEKRTPKPEPGVYLIPGDYAQCHIRMGRQIPDLYMTSPDYAAARVQNYAVGYGRVFLRTRLAGLSYGCGAFLTVGDERSTLEAFGSCRPEVTVQLLQAARQEVQGVETEPLSSDEVKTSKNFLIGTVIQRNERASNVVSSKLTDLVNDRPEDFLGRYFSALKDVDSLDATRCGRKYNHFNDSLVVLVVGDPSKFDTPLDSLGLGPVIELEEYVFGE